MGKPFTIDPRETRRIASSMGIPENMPLPPVQVEAKRRKDQLASLEQLSRTPKLRREYPAGFAILISPESLKYNAKGMYTLGSEAIDLIRHELYHYTQRKKGSKARYHNAMSVDTLIAWELDADLKSGRTMSPSMSVAEVAYNTSVAKGLSIEEALERTKRIAREKGVSESVLSRVEGVLRTHGKLAEGIEETPSKGVSENVVTARKKTRKSRRGKTSAVFQKSKKG